MRLHANHVSIDESGDEFFQVSFDSEARSESDFDLSEPDHTSLLIQRQFEDDDGGVCYIETHDHDTYAGHFRLRLIEVTPTRLAFEIARTENKFVEVTDDLDAKRFDDRNSYRAQLCWHELRYTVGYGQSLSSSPKA